MATLLNAYNCLTSGGNTGVGSCSLDIKNIIGAIILPSGTLFNSTQLATANSFIAALQQATLADRPNRAYPIHDFEGMTDATEDVTIQTLGYSGKYPVKEGDYDLTFQFVKGGFCLHKSLRAFNGQAVDVILIDKKYLGIGLKVGTGMRGIPLRFVYSKPFTFSDGSNITNYSIRFVFPPDFIDSIGFVQLNITDWMNTVGLRNIALESGGARVANVSLVKAAFSCGGGDFYGTYGATLASAAYWTAKDSVSGNTLDITSVTVNTNIQGWTITVSTTDPDYVAGNPVILSLASASILNTAGILGVESNTLTTPN